MSIEDEITFLERLPMLRPLGSGALRSLAIAAETYSMQPGEVLFTAGEDADGAYILQQGSVTLKPLQGPEAVAGPGTLLGESALLAETKRSASVTAREASMLMRVSRASFLIILDSYPDAAQRLRDHLALRANQWARDMENVRAVLSRGKRPE
jgi:CRP-like cAMP-binding protein